VAENSTKIVLTAEDRTSPALQSVTRGLQGMQTQADLAGRALGALGVTFSAAAAVAFVKGTIDAADGMNDLSQKVGIGIRQLAGWTLAANQSGTSMESVARGIKGLSGYMVEHGDKLRAAGITATDANGAMIQLADLFSALPDGVQKTTLAVQLFGKAGMDMIPMLNQGSAGLAEAQEKADAYGKKMAELAPDADKFNDQIEELSLHMKALGIGVTTSVLPGLIGMAKWLGDIATGGERAQQAVAWMIGEQNMKAMVLMGHPGLTGSGSRSASGRIGGPAGPTLADEEALASSNMAGMQAAGLLDKGGAGRAAKASRFDPFGDFEQKFADMNEKAKRARMDAADKEMEAIDAKARAMDEAHMKRMEANRIESEGEEAIRESLEKTSRELAKQKDMAHDLGFTFASAAEDAILKWESVGDVLRGLGQDVARIFLRSTITEPLGNSLAGAFKGMGGGSGLLSGLKNMFTFDGGGYTGMGARSGGLDGKGGFMAVLHPNETVTDHTKGGATGGVTIVQNINIDSRSDQGTIAAAMVQAKNAAVAEVHNAMRRGAWA
jgi:hypothetical protein